MRAALLQACVGLAVAAASLCAADAPDRVSTDGPAIFRRALWRHPTPADHIPHAERREWGAPDQVERWEWYLVIEPSEPLLKYLRVDNAFALSAHPKPNRPADAPDWWNWEVSATSLASRSGDLVLVFDDPAHRLYARGTGRAPRPGAPEPEPKATPTPAPTGRLPPTSPPKPEP